MATSDEWGKTRPGQDLPRDLPQSAFALSWVHPLLLSPEFPGWLRGLALLWSGNYHSLGKRRVNTQFTWCSDFLWYNLAIKFTNIHSTSAISKTLSWTVWVRYTEELITAHALKDSFHSRKDRHISHTTEYNYNKKQIVLSAIIEVVQIKCRGTMGKTKINLFQLEACGKTSERKWRLYRTLKDGRTLTDGEISACPELRKYMDYLGNHN